MKQLIILGLVLSLLCSVNLVSQASYYDVKFNIGEHTSDINNQLYLDYQGQTENYDVTTELRVDKDYRFLSGRRYEDDWELNDYLMTISNQQRTIEVGETTAKSLSNFVASDSLVGVLAQQDNYNLWYGKQSNQDFVFGGSSSGLNRLGFSYDGKRRQFSYQYQEELVTDRHYLAYQDGYKLSSFDLLVDTAVAVTEEEIGPVIGLNLSSWYQGISYRWKANYYTPEFQEIEQSIFSSGKYDLSLETYQKLGQRYILENNIKYSEDNLDNSQNMTSREWELNNTLSYFAPNYNRYHLGVDYRIYNYSDNKLELSLNGELKKLEFDINYTQAQEQEIYLSLDYQKGPFDYFCSYRADENQNSWDHDAEVEVAYDKQLKDDLNYNSIVNVSYFSDDYRINLTQGLRYQIKENQDLGTRLSLNHYFGSDDLTKRVIVDYKYKF
ncbi:MAG: hypothetical protein ACQEQI_08825 [Bacillota bacterium]